VVLGWIYLINMVVWDTSRILCINAFALGWAWKSMTKYPREDQVCQEVGHDT